MAYQEFAYFYDEFNGAADYDALFAYVTGELKAHGIQDGIVADFGCGTGELTLMLAQAGYDMIGIDVSEEMLSVLRDKADALGLPLTNPMLLCQDLLQLDLYGTIRAAVSTFDTYNHIGPLENFEKAQKLDPSNLTIQFNLAEAHYVNHDYARALKAFTELLPPFKDNPGMTPLLQFKRYICARKLDNRPLAKELENLYGPMDDTPYYYCTQAIIKFMGGDKDAAQEQLLSAIRIHGGTSAIQAFTDAMTEAGILPSPYGQTVPTEQPAKTGLEKRR